MKTLQKNIKYYAQIISNPISHIPQSSQKPLRSWHVSYHAHDTPIPLDCRSCTARACFYNNSPTRARARDLFGKSDNVTRSAAPIFAVRLIKWREIYIQSIQQKQLIDLHTCATKARNTSRLCTGTNTKHVQNHSIEMCAASNECVCVCGGGLMKIPHSMFELWSRRVVLESRNGAGTII